MPDDSLFSRDGALLDNGTYIPPTLGCHEACTVAEACGPYFKADKLCRAPVAHGGTVGGIVLWVGPGG